LSGWSAPAGDLFAFLTAKLPDHFGRSDIVLNVLVYMPVGLLFMLALKNNSSPIFSIILASIIGTLLSFSMETIQVYLPNRTPSVIDLITNAFGSFLGAGLGGMFHKNTLSGQKIISLRNQYFVEGSWVNMGLLIIALWALMHLSPIVVTLDIGKIREGLAPTWHLLQDPTLFRGYSFFSSFMFFIGLNIIVRQIVNPGRPATLIFVLFSLAVMLAKVFVISRQISPEQLLALFTATIFTTFLSNPRTNAASKIAFLAVIIGYILSELAPGTGLPGYKFNWIPFSDQNANLNGVSSILENIWPFMAAGYLVHISIQEKMRNFAIIAGGIFVVSFSFTMEWLQQEVPGRSADISSVLVALAGWTVPLSRRLNPFASPAHETDTSKENQFTHRLRGTR